MKRIHVSRLMMAAKSRKPGYDEACRKRGQLEGVWLTLSDEDHAAIREEFALAPRPKVTMQNPGIPRRMGLGDAIGRPASWIGQKMKLDCMERDAAGNATRILKPDSPCAARKARLNAIGEKVTTVAKRLIPGR